MGSKGRIDSIVDIPKIQDEIKFLTGSLERVLVQIESIAEAGAKLKFEGFGQAKSIKDAAAATSEMEKALKEVESLTAKLNKISNERLELEKRLVNIENERIGTSQATSKTTQDEVTWSLKKVSAVFDEVRLSKELKNAINAILGTKQENIKRLAEEQARLKEVNSSMRDNAKAFENGVKNGKEYLATQQRLINKQSTLKVAISELTARIKQEEKIEQVATGTAKEKSVILDKLREAYRNLSEEQKNNSTIGGQLLKEINKLDEGLKEYDATIGNHQRNVGDYAIGNKSLRTELYNLTEQLAEMKLQGLETSDVYQELAQKTGAISDAMRDAKSEVKKLASDSGDLDQLISVAEGLAAAYTVIEGATALMGVENEELQQTFVKLQAAMAVLNGLRSIQNVLQKESAAYTLAENLQKKLNILLIYAQNKAETGGIVTRKLATAAQWALNKAMLANPAGLLLAALAGLVAIGYVLFKVFTSNSEIQKTYAKAINETKKSVENLNKELERNVKYMEASGESAQAIIRERIKAANEEYDQQSRLISTLNKDRSKLTDEQLEQLKELEKAQIENTAKIAALNDDLTINTLKQQRETQKLKIENMQDGLNKELALINIERDEKIKAARDNAELINQINAQVTKKAGELRMKAAETYLKAEQDTINKLAESRIAIMNEGFTKELSGLRLQYGQKIVELENQLKTEENLTREQRKRIKETILNIRKEQAIEEEKLISQSEINANQKQIDLISTRLQSVKKGTDEELDLRLRSLTLQKENELANAELTSSEKQAIIDKYIKLEADEAFNFLSDQLNKESQQRLLAVDKQMSDELGILRNQLEDKEITAEQYAQRRAKIEAGYNIKRAEHEVELAKKAIENLKANGADTLEAEKKLVDAQMALDDAKTQNFIENIEKQKQAQEQLNQRLTDLGQELFNTSQSFANASYEKKTQQLEADKSKDEEAKEAELERAGNNALLKEEINAKYAAREKQREKEIKRMQAEKARADKLFAIFQVAINTGLAISKIWAEVPKFDFGISTAALTAIAAGIGAAQIAAIAAQPIPKYFKGRKGGKAEIAWVGEQGSELIQHNGKSVLTPDQPTLTFLPSGASVIPHQELLSNPAMFVGDRLDYMPQMSNEALQAEIASLHDDFNMLARVITSKREFHLNITERGIWASAQRGASVTEYINSHIRM